MRACASALLALGPALAFASCGDDDGERASSSGSGGSQAAAPPPASPMLLEESGALTASDPTDGRGRYDRYFVDAAANDRLIVTVTSSTFDPVVEVTPPSGGTLINDDWQGDRTRSQIELLAGAAGAMKVEVRSYAREGQGEYRVSVRRVAAGGAQPAQGAPPSVPVLAVGESTDGELAEGDHTLSGGEVFDSYVLRAQGAIRVAVSGRGGAAPRTTLVGPNGLTLEPTGGRYEAPSAGTYRLQVIGARGTRYRVEVSSTSADSAPILARAHHQFRRILEQFRPAPGEPVPATAQPPQALPVRVGDRLGGNLAATDPRLPSGEHYDVYELAVSAPAGEVSVELESSAFDAYLRVEGPGGQTWENDDWGGTLSSRVEVPLSQPGTYRVVTTSYRAGETGPYELRVLARRTGPAANGGPGTPAAEQAVEGALQQDDRTLRSGEYFDEHRFTWPAGARVHIEARSTEFDTYLIVHPPSGPQRDNDDMTPGQGLNAGMDIQVSEAGEWRVLVTSYRPGETGRYVLAVNAPSTVPAPAPAPSPAPTPAPSPAPTPPSAGSRTETGTLAQGDRTLRSGELMDTYSMTFTPRSAVQIRLESSDFDPYLIVRSPSGHQEDNDDLQPGVLHSGIDIPVAEPGTYSVIVTSYRPGETGRYTLRVTEGQSVVAPPSGGPSGTPPAASGGGHVWGLFAGITDYPGGVNDLPECANDARKLAEAVRNQGNMPSDQEFLLTDGQATVANVRRAMQTIAQRIGPDDVLVFFYSGHGGQTESSRDTRELDARDEYLLLHDGQLMDDELGQLFDQVRARVALVAIDACFSGGFAKDVITRPGRVGMFSSEEDVTSAVAGRFQAGGYLSHFLRLGIQGEADTDPHNDILTVGELTHYTWLQFGRHASDVRMSMGYQHLVVDRGAVRTSEVLWAVRR